MYDIGIRPLAVSICTYLKHFLFWIKIVFIDTYWVWDGILFLLKCTILLLFLCKEIFKGLCTEKYVGSPFYSYFFWKFSKEKDV